MQHKVLLALMIGTSLILSGCYSSRYEGSQDRVQTRLERLVEHSAVTVQEMKAEQDFKDLLADAKGVLIFPKLIEASFIGGGEGGTGVLVAKNNSGNWSSPAFYSLGAGSFGLQAGFKEAQVVILFMNDKVLQSSIRTGLTFGADASAVAWEAGAETEYSNVTGKKDIIYFANADGLYAGVSLESAVIKTRKDYNRRYYERGADPWEIVMEGAYENPHAQVLKDALQ